MRIMQPQARSDFGRSGLILIVMLALPASLSSAQDCNNNGLGDGFEVTGVFENESPGLPIATPGSVTHTIPDAPPATGQVSFTIYGANAQPGTVSLSVNGTNVDTTGFSNAGCTAQAVVLVVPASAYNAELTGGGADIEIAVLGPGCPGGSTVALITSYPVLPSADCDGGGVPDECDLAAGTSVDCDVNGVPDECDPDCNCNGQVDRCEITAGTALDCNSNSVPDECESLCVGDADGDRDMELDDFESWPDCATGPANCPPDCPAPFSIDPCCRFLDLDVDGDIDLIDFGERERIRSLGPPPCNCPAEDCSLPTIYVGIVMHNEEPGADPDYLANSNAFHFAREMVVEFANMLYDEGVKFDYQSDWNFLRAMQLYDDHAGTNNKNLLRYLREDLGFEIDPHAHETLYNYADVAFLDMQLLGGPATRVVGGMIYYPPEESKLEYLWNPITGWQFPGFTWQPEILWGASTFLHQGNDERASGVWRPKNTYEFFTDDPARLPYVGGYTKNAQGVLDLIELAEAGALSADKIYTTTMNYTQRAFQDPADIAAVRDDIRAIKQRDQYCLVQWSSLEDIVEDWETVYGSEPNVLYVPDFEPNPVRRTVRLDSAAAPLEGIAVRIYAPYPGNERYPEGAPVAVFIKGSHDAQIVSDDDDTHVLAALEHGYIHVSFTMPGGQNGVASESSGGTFDYRGPDCKQALADLLEFALGLDTDTNGDSITDLVPSALTDNVGVVARSNGGNLALTTLNEYSADLGGVAWIAFYESPIGDQMVVSELGSPQTGMLNPFYVLGTTTVTTSPLPGMESVLAFDGSVPFSMIDPATGLTTNVNGIFYLDENTNGMYDAAMPAEFAFSPLPGPGNVVGGPPKAYTSVELAAMIGSNAVSLFPSGPPPWLATPVEVNNYWAERDGSEVLAGLAAVMPSLRMMAIGTETDHGVIAEDHPHVSALVNGWIGAGGDFIRLNPDSAYLELVTGIHSVFLPDNDANQAMVFVNEAATDTLMIPESVLGDVVPDSEALAAAVLELADRTRAVYWADNLSGVLVP